MALMEFMLYKTECKYKINRSKVYRYRIIEPISISVLPTSNATYISRNIVFALLKLKCILKLLATDKLYMDRGI